MTRRLDHPLALVVGLTAATWPVWRWYIRRLGDGSDEQWGLLALGAAAMLSISRRVDPGWPAAAHPLMAGLLTAYALSCLGAPPLLRAVAAMMALGVLASCVRFGRLFHPGVAGLLVLALPVGASMEYYLGYPLRMAAAGIAVPLIRLAGYGVESQGTGLLWLGETVLLDAPCSGIRMLWTGLFLACFLTAALRLDSWRTLGTLAGAGIAVVLANGIRTAVLFFQENAIVPLPHWAHDGAGLAVFAAASAGIVLSLHRLERRTRCSTA